MIIIVELVDSMFVGLWEETVRCCSRHEINELKWKIAVLFK